MRGRESWRGEAWERRWVRSRIVGMEKCIVECAETRVMVAI